MGVATQRPSRPESASADHATALPASPSRDVHAIDVVLVAHIRFTLGPFSIGQPSLCPNVAVCNTTPHVRARVAALRGKVPKGVAACESSRLAEAQARQGLVKEYGVACPSGPKHERESDWSEKK